MRKSEIDRIAIYVDDDNKDGREAIKYHVFDHDDDALEFAIKLIDLQKTFKFVEIRVLKVAEEEVLLAYNLD